MRRLREAAPELPEFDARLRAAGIGSLARGRLEILQLNLGKLCNMRCRHCHVDAGPERTEEQMDRPTLEACLEAVDRLRPDTVDLTGGAPELNAGFRWLVGALSTRSVRIIDRCNLSVLLLPVNGDLPAFLADHRVEVVASLPHWRRPSTDRQRGDGAHARSIEGIRRLNAAGYGMGDPDRCLTLMHNPVGPFLPSALPSMEREWKEGLAREWGLRFDRLIALNNMPIARFLESLEAGGGTAAYLRGLHASFNPAAAAGLMCRNTVSVGWDGRVFDCDFNQMVEIGSASARHVSELAQVEGHAIRTDRHCYGCTAGNGSSCGGSTS